MKKNQKEALLALTEAAMMIALATVLSFIKLVKYPWGGSITLLSMLPIVLYSIRRGVPRGLGAAFVYALIQLFLSLAEVVSWGLTPAALVGCLALDYLLPFTLLGVAGCFRRHGWLGSVGGVMLALALRMVSHFLSGVVIFASTGRVINIQIDNTYLYSLAYNALYMVPEMIFTGIACVILFKLPRTRRLLTEKIA